MRLSSLDVFRGIAITGMILVNNASLADQVYPALDHADWSGCTLADLVFPFFLFIVGVAMAFSFSKYTKEGIQPTPAIYWRILRRSAILFALGLLLNGFYTYDFSTIRIMGVLQRISLAYLLTSFAVLTLPRKGQWALAALILVGYWLAMSFVPIPDYGFPNLTTREGNIGAYIDRWVIGGVHLYKGDKFNSMGDPEGLLGTLPAIVTVLIGYFTGQWLRQQQEKSHTSMDMVLFGLSCLVVGEVWGFWFPISKKMWTSSFVMFTAGWALLLLAACYELIEVRKRKRWGWPFEVMGLNAIFVFVASVLLIKILVKTNIGSGANAPTTYAWINEHFFQSWAGPLNGPLLLAILTVLFWWVILYGMYRQRWFLKI
ncbi:MAG: lpg1661 family Dot/Icm T4SS effector [Chamaesiphon sp.]